MKCKTKWCRNTAARKELCYKCLSKEYRKNHLDRYTFNALKQNAKRRGKAFTITFEEFLNFCTETDYLKKKGIDPNSITIDRIDETKGYTRSNIRAVYHRVNSLRNHYGYIQKMQREGNYPDSEEDWEAYLMHEATQKAKEKENTKEESIDFDDFDDLEEPPF